MTLLLKIYKVVIAALVAVSFLIAAGYGFFLYFPLSRIEPDSLEFTHKDKSELIYNQEKYIRTTEKFELSKYIDFNDFLSAVSLGCGKRFSYFIPALKNPADFRKIHLTDKITGQIKYEEKEKLGYFVSDEIIVNFEETEYYTKNAELYFNEKLLFSKELTADDIEKITIFTGNFSATAEETDSYIYSSGEEVSDDIKNADILLKFLGRQSYYYHVEAGTIESDDGIKEFFDSLKSNKSFIDYYDNIWKKYYTKYVYYKVDIKNSPVCLFAFPVNVTRYDVGYPSSKLEDYNSPMTSKPAVLELTSCERIGIKEGTDGYFLKLKGKNISAIDFISNEELFLVLNNDDGAIYHIKAENADEPFFVKANSEFEYVFQFDTDAEDTKILEFLFETGSDPTFKLGDEILLYKYENNEEG